MKRWRVAIVVAISMVVLIGGGFLWLLSVNDNDARYAGVVSIEQSSDFRNTTLIARAERQPVAVSYLSHHFEFQSNASVCGPTSAADLLHSIGRPDSPSEVLANADVTSVFGFIPGLTLDQEASLLRKMTAVRVTLLRDLTLAEFRNYLAQANDRSVRFIVNFHRGPMFGRGHGHFSPILAYLPDRDFILLGDVNRSYGIYLVNSRRLFDAMNTVDAVTGKTRGLLMISFGQKSASHDSKRPHAA